MVSRASLVADRKHEILRQRLLHLERVKIRVRYRHVSRVRIDIRCALIGENCRQPVGGIQRCNQGWIRWIAEWVIAGTQIERDLPIYKWIRVSAATDAIVRHVRRIISSVVEDIVVKAIVGHSESPANDQPVVKLHRAPGKTETRSEIVPGRFQLLAWIVGG